MEPSTYKIKQNCLKGEDVFSLDNRQSKEHSNCMNFLCSILVCILIPSMYIAVLHKRFTHFIKS